MASNNMVELHVTSNISSFESVRRFPSSIQISELKSNLELITGACAKSMKVQLLDRYKKEVEEKLADDKELKFYPVEDGMFLHVIDPTHQVGEFEDLSSVEKVEISEEKYKARDNNFRAFRAKLNLASNEEVAEKKEEIEKKMAEKITVGSRCEVHVSKQPKRKGIIRYVGEVSFKPGFWVGVEYDEPLGKNDGSCQGKRYFECPPNYGGFVKPQDVVVHQFQEVCDEI